MHELECKSCNSIFPSDTKLKDHMCRLHVSNPSNKFLYMKDWFVMDSCIRVYDSGQQKEIALLHSDNCDKLKPCSDYPSVSMKGTAKVKDKNGLIHLHAGTHFERNSMPEEVIWDILNFNIYYYEE